MQTFPLLCTLTAAALARRPLDQDTVAAVAWDRVDWPRLVRLSGTHLLTPALAGPLADPGLDPWVPAELRDYLAAIHAAAAQRNLALRAQVAAVAAELNGIDVVPVLLKGAIRLVDGLWPDPALRFMNDLDLLVPETELWNCVARLVRAGWQPCAATRQDLAQHVILVHPDAPVRIELHRQPLGGELEGLLPATRMLARATTLGLDGATVALPALEDQLVHLVAHGTLQHAFLRSGRCVLRELAELKLLLGRAEERDVTLARERFAAHGQLLAWEVCLELLARCLGGAPAAETLAARILVARTLLQQRSPWAMLILGPLGWCAARLAPGPADEAPPTGARRLAGRFRMFYRKTMW